MMATVLRLTIGLLGWALKGSGLLLNLHRLLAKAHDQLRQHHGFIESVKRRERAAYAAYQVAMQQAASRPAASPAPPRLEAIATYQPAASAKTSPEIESWITRTQASMNRQAPGKDGFTVLSTEDWTRE
jgi:hypothetical protein